MNRSTKLAATACGLLGALIAAEAWTGVGRPDAAAPIESRAAAVLPETDSRAAVSAASAVREIEARPLFSASRRPARRVQSLAKVDMTVKPLRHRLTGIVVEPSVRAAVFAVDGAKRGIIVKEGEAIDGWFLERVTPVGVTLRAAGVSQTVELTGIKAKTNKGGGEHAITLPVVPSMVPAFLRTER